MRYTVDRITDDYIVLQDENGVSGQADKKLFPFLKEGDILSVSVDSEATKLQKEHLQKRLNSLFEKGKNK